MLRAHRQVVSPSSSHPKSFFFCFASHLPQHHDHKREERVEMILGNNGRGKKVEWGGGKQGARTLIKHVLIAPLFWFPCRLPSFMEATQMQMALP